MKVAYFCSLTQLDTDLSYIQEAQKLCDLTVYIYVNPKHFNKSIIKLNKIYDKSGVFDADIYPEFAIFKSIINLDNVKIINIANSRNWQMKAFKIYQYLYAKLKKNFDIVHITSILQPPEFPLYLLGKKLVLTVHDPIPHSFYGGGKYWMARKLTMKVVRNFIIFNKAQKNEFIIKYNLKNSNVFVSQFGTFPWMKLINPYQELFYENNKEYILFAGRISQYKGIDYLLQSMDLVHKKYPSVKLIVAGGGRFHFDISPWLDSPYVEFKNRFIPDNELVSLIKNSEFVVCPYTDATQSGVVMSAFTFDKPVLATNVGGLPEMIENHRHGLIVKEKDVDALAEGISQMLEDKSMLEQYSRNISKDYSDGARSWISIAKNINNFYEEITQHK